MNPEIKAEWLKRLKSGDYTPAEGSLKKTSGEDNYKHCCLGVLAEIAIEQGIIPSMDHAKADAVFDEDTGELIESGSEYLGPAVCEWAGIGPKTYIDSDQGQLGSENDDAFYNDDNIPTTYPDGVIEYITENL